MARSRIAVAKISPQAALKTNRAIVCSADDNQSIVLNAQRTSLKYTVEGESLGAKKIAPIKTDNETYVSYQNSEGWLTFNERGSYYRYNGDQDTTQVECQFAK